jgi:hypothetical protein
MRKSLFFVVLSIIILSGCGRPFDVNINSISHPSLLTTEKTCIVLSGMKDINSSDLQFQEYKSYIKRALEYKGYILSDDIEKAKMIILISYSISNPVQDTYSYNAPVYGQTGISSAYTTGTVNSYGHYSGTTTYTPSYGVTGYTTHVGTRYFYIRAIVLEAFDAKKTLQGQQEAQCWKTSITSTGSSGDLREVFPVMIGAATEYIGENTKKLIHISLHENDKRVLWVKGNGNLEKK